MPILHMYASPMHYYDYEMSLGDLQPQDERPNNNCHIYFSHGCTSHDVLGMLGILWILNSKVHSWIDLRFDQVDEYVNYV